MANIDISKIKHTKLADTKTLITVSLAKQLWANNASNRKFRANHAEHIARQMKLGRYEVSPDPIVITDKGRLVNGQHRMWSIVTTKIACEFDVKVIPDEDFDKVFAILDQGATRSNADVLKQDNKVITPISYLLRSCGVSKVTPEDLRPFVDSDMGRIMERLNSKKLNGKIWRHTCFKAAVAVCILSGRADEERLFATLEHVSNSAITEWPHIFGQLYVQLTDATKPLYQSGRSLSNDWFMRSMFALTHMEGRTKTIRIKKPFAHDVETTVLSVMQSINASFLE